MSNQHLSGGMKPPISSEKKERKKKEPRPEGKPQGLSFRHCFLHNKLYSRSGKGIYPYLYIFPFLLAYLVLDFTLRSTYDWMGVVGAGYLPANLFTISWTLIFAGLVFCLPGFFKWFVRCVPLVTFVTIAVTHSGFMSVFGKFFSFSILQYVGGGEFASTAYIHIARRVVAGAAVTVLLMMTSGRLIHILPPKQNNKTTAIGLLAFAVGVTGVNLTQKHYFPTIDTVIWANNENDTTNAIYQDFTDGTNSLLVSGLYQYTVRDLWLQIHPATALSASEQEQVESYISGYEAAETDNAYTGLFQGKNVIMVQLEAIDTWMMDPDYMPNLAKLKSEGISFANHYSPAYITAGTFNSEFMVNTGLLPATGGISTTVYPRNSFPYSLANLFEKQGYTANSFHNSEGDVYNRGVVHPNLGYEAYHSGSDMKMENYELDRYLINGFDEMTAKSPYFSFLITFSGHGPYGEDNPIYQANAETAKKAAKRTDGSYVYAVAGAMETDRLIGELMDKLTESGHKDDTVLIFYADHYNYYMMNDNLQMQIKGVDNMNMLAHTDFFLWADGITPMVVDKVTSTPDIFPTLANLFNLDTTGAFLAGHDGLGDQGGYVFFADKSWYDGKRYWAYGSPDADTARSGEISRVTTLSNRILSSNYYAN